MSRLRGIPFVVPLIPAPFGATAHVRPRITIDSRPIEMSDPKPTHPRNDGADLPASPFAEFSLRERDAVPVETTDERLVTARQLLRATWPVSTDTFVTGDLPLLLTRAGQIDPRR
jgi:hypothetical protein